MFILSSFRRCFLPTSTRCGGQRWEVPRGAGAAWVWKDQLPRHEIEKKVKEVAEVLEI
jgi:hypothetical protein